MCNFEVLHHRKVFFKSYSFCFPCLSKQHLTVSSAATRHAISSKQRQLEGVEHVHGRALVSVCSVRLNQAVFRNQKCFPITVYFVLDRVQCPVEICSPEKGWTGQWFSCTKDTLVISCQRLCKLYR